MKIPTREQLEKRRAIVIADLLAKVEADDMHGVADCAMDCREIDAMLKSADRIKTLEESLANVCNSRGITHA